MRRKLLVAMLMLMAVMVLFGCSDSDPQNEAGDAVQYYDFFGERQLSDEELEALCHETDEKIIKRKISTVADCAKYFELMQAQQTGQLSTSASCAEAFNHLLMNDYDEGGTGSFKYKSRTYTLPYIKHENAYYLIDAPVMGGFNACPLDVSSLHGTDIDGLISQMKRCSDFTFTTIYQGRVVIRQDIEFAEVDYEFFGKRQLSDEELRELIGKNDSGILQEKIATVADCAKYFELIQNQPELQLPDAAACVDTLTYLLHGDYEAGGYGEFIEFHENKFHIAYLKQDGLYYLIDAAAMCGFERCSIDTNMISAKSLAGLWEQMANCSNFCFSESYAQH